VALDERPERVVAAAASRRDQVAVGSIVHCP
jgi:hypothetical protein